MAHGVHSYTRFVQRFCTFGSPFRATSLTALTFVGMNGSDINGVEDGARCPGRGQAGKGEEDVT
jgi:hypothetical protein